MIKFRFTELVRTQVQPYFLASVSLWTLIMLISFIVQTQQMSHSIKLQMEETARTEYFRDLLIRRWATLHGGVYVPVTPDLKPNPYLKDVPERDVVTPSGKKLTLLSPEFMLRDIYEVKNREEGNTTHLTSLKSLNPKNLPDDWEIEALKSFEVGEEEVFGLAPFKGQEHFRFMRPLKTEAGCLKCHAAQGYHVGQVRGGISISFPSAPWMIQIQNGYLFFGAMHFFAWLVGILGIIYFRNHVAQKVKNFEVLQEQLIKAKEKAEEADKTKSQFLANMSHEIRTPMNAIVGYADLLKEGELSAGEQQDALSIINRNSNHLVQIINDLLDLSKFETQSVVLIKQPFDLRKLFSDTFDLTVAEIDQKKVCPLLRLDENLAKHYLGDAVRLRQIIVNLLNNAIKFTSEGTIALKVQVQNQAASIHELHILVEDSGVGMSPEYQTQIFKPFSQEDSTLAKRFGGAGLGLAIVKRLVDAMGATIEVRSQQGAGSVFEFVLRLPALSEEEEIHLSEKEVDVTAPVGKYPHWVGKKILVVEDTATSAMVLLSWLKKTNCQIVFAENGQEAMSIIAKQKFDLVLMDIQMPIIDGMTAAKQLRAQGNNTPLIALSAHAFAEQRQAAYDVGFNGYIVKPFHWQDVRQEIERFLSANHN